VQAANAEATTDRKLYSFFVNKQARVLELKEKHIKREFGFENHQIRMYFKYRELGEQQFIMDVPQFDIEEDILVCVTLNAPENHVPVILREPLDDIKIADVRLLNSRDKNDPQHQGKADPAQNFDLDRFDVDLDKLPWPAYTDWTSDAAYLSDIIVKNKTVLLNEEQ
jgi:hypothetical protein